ncbi:MAG: MvaI/BcnI family restriction endonuclease [Bacteroidales bacterium]|nr:MvaI/BcnI family restriction endonuclease [Bacteroidales bacterium]
MRPFTAFEKRNMEYLVNHNIKFTQVQITATGLKKSILDATTPMRTYFKENGVHDYACQLKGQDYKVTIPTHILSSFKDIDTQTSLYRPETKDGDPRLWIYKLKETTEADDIHAIIAMNPKLLYVINITKVDIQKCCETSIVNPIADLIHDMSLGADMISEELLALLMNYQNKWIDTDLRADTAIGRQVEALLGIDMNDSPLPDYKGIELKSFRSQRPSIRKNLFCKVPDWDISYLKSGADIVDKYGYLSGGVKSYRNTLRCSAPNTQNLRLNMNYPDNLLEIEEDRVAADVIKKVADVAVWRLQTLHQCLLTKHHETFWIEVDTRVGENGQEQFMFNKIEHTRNPIVSQFDILLEQSMITVDLLLGRPKVDPETGKQKKGGDSVSFKIKKNAAGLLFPNSITYKF